MDDATRSGSTRAKRNAILERDMSDPLTADTFEGIVGRLIDGTLVNRLPAEALRMSYVDAAQGKITKLDLVGRFNLTETQAAEFDAIVSTIQSDMTLLEDDLVANGMNVASAEEIARETVSGAVEQIFKMTEYGYVTKSEFNAEFGIV